VKRLLPLSVASLLIVLVGCEITTSGEARRGSSSERTVNEQQFELLQRIDEFEERTDLALDSLMKDADRRRAQESAETGAAVAKDVQAAQSVLREAEEAAQQKKHESAAAGLARLDHIVLSMQAEVPAAVISQQVERAVAAITVAHRPADASAALLVAYDEGVREAKANATAHLVPEVLKDIERAKTYTDAGRSQEALAVLNLVLEKASQEPTAQMLEKVREGIAGAKDALGRQAWPVVQAELLELDRMLAEVASRVQPEPVAPPTVEAEEIEETAASGEAEEGAVETAVEEEATEEAPSVEEAGGDAATREAAPAP